MNKPTPSRRLSARWVAQRQRLHDRFEQIQHIRDASQFAYFRGPGQAFSEAEVVDLWRETAATQVGGIPPRNHVYIHVPFCKSICTFCNYERLRASSPKLLEDWEFRLLRSLEAIAPAIQSMRFHSLYFGGGTPSVLPAPMLDRVLTALERHLDFVPGAGRHIELDPAVISKARIQVLSRHGFQRVSFGVQTLDPAVNQAHNRGAQGPQTVASCFDQLLAHDIDQISCDFLLGLEGTTPEQILAELTTVLQARKALSIDVFTLVPTQVYVDQHFGGSTEAFWQHMARFEEQVLPVLGELAQHNGYRLVAAAGHCFKLVRKQAARTQTVLYSYTQLSSQQQRPLNLLGLGLSARSQIFGRAAFQYQDPRPGDSQRKTWYQGHPLSLEQEIQTYLVHQLRDNDQVDRVRFEGIFGRPIEQAIPVALAVWQSRSLVEITPDAIRLVPQTRMERARTLMWLVSDEDFEREVGRVLGLELGNRGVAALLRRLPRQTRLAGEWHFSEVRQGRIILEAVRVRARLRLAPPLRDGDATRLILETPPPTEPGLRLGLRTSIQRLQALLTRWHGIPRGGRRAEPAPAQPSG